MPIEPSEFRRILGHWITGVAIVASRTADDEPCGFTANAFTSLSLEPPLVLVCVDRAGNSHASIRDAGVFTVNVLGSGDERLARHFATDSAAKFTGIAWTTAATGAPVLEAALAWVDCTVRTEVPGGDHTIFIGEVVDGDADEGEPLIFYRGGYGRFAP
jgi:flavin reductase (DIM6/NTAB) family NADH-FMN oxidoreductase RutF